MSKLIILILFLLIFVNITTGKKCKCDKNEDKGLFHRWHKRAFRCCCFGGKNSETKDNNEESERKPPRECNRRDGNRREGNRRWN